MLPTDVEADLSEHLDGLRTAHPELRWVPPARWHVTVEFLGECGPHEVERQLNRWAVRAGRCEPLRLSLAGAGTFPQAWRARVFWAGLDVDAAAWRRLAHHAQQPHLTLARTKKEAADVTGMVDELSSYAGPEWVAEDVGLVESHLRGGSDRGPRYEVIERFPLGH
jgi:2'-5' RNA ligase